MAFLDCDERARCVVVHLAHDARGMAGDDAQDGFEEVGWDREAMEHRHQIAPLLSLKST
jgi:hypothetical protein